MKFRPSTFDRAPNMFDWIEDAAVAGLEPHLYALLVEELSHLLLCMDTCVVANQDRIASSRSLSEQTLEEVDERGCGSTLVELIMQPVHSG